MPQLRLGTGREVAWVVAAGFYPSFGDKNRLRTKYASQPKPRLTPMLHMHGLPHRAAFGGITPAAKAVGTPKPKDLISGGPPQRGFTIAPDAVGDVEQKLRKKLFAEGAKYTLQGHHAWWSAGTDLMNINALAKDLYASMIRIRPNASSASELKEATNIIYDQLISGFSEFEDSRGHAATKNMIDTITENSLEGADLDEFVTNYWNLNERDVDVPEEEWRDLLRSGLLDVADAEYRKPEEALGTSNKIDVTLMLTRLNEALKLDVTEALLSSSEETYQGTHGILRKMAWTAHLGRGEKSTEPSYQWIEDNRADVETDIANFFRESIEHDYNPAIREMIAAVSQGSIPEPLELVGPTVGSQTAAIAAGALYTSNFFENLTQSQQQAAFSATSQIQDRLISRTTTPTGEYAAKGGMRRAKQREFFTYILHNIANINNLGPIDFFYQTHRVSKRNRLGDAWYAFVPMSMISQGDSEWPSPSASGWPSPAYEFRSEGRRSPEETMVLNGPNATLSMLVHRGIVNEWRAKEINLFQNRVSITKDFHSAAVQQMNDRSILSTTNAETTVVNKHAFTVSYAPTDMIGFFARFVQQLSNGLSSKEAKKIGEATIAANNYKLINPIRSPAPHKFWALPYIAFEDNLERKAGDIYSWFNEEQEKLNSKHAIKGGKISGGWAGLGGAAKSRGGH